MATDISLHDTTFIIPIRIDSLIRLENLLAVVHYLKAIQCNIMVVESLTSNMNVTKKLLPKGSNIYYVSLNSATL